MLFEQEANKIWNKAMANNWCLVLNRLPGTDVPELMIQFDSDCRIIHYEHEINNSSGFLMAPFNHLSSNGTLLVQPNLVFSGWELNEIWSQNNQDKQRFISANSMPSISHYAASYHLPETKKEKYLKQLYALIGQMKTNAIGKIVLSRIIKKNITQPLNIGKLFIDLCAAYPNAYVCMAAIPAIGTWIGASPELLVDIDNNKLHTVALAGTQKKPRNPFKTRWGAKERDEQLWVTDYIVEKFNELGIGNFMLNGPFTATAGDIAHLKTTFEVDVPDNFNLGQMLNRFHPTPAVCGRPKGKALQVISEAEPHERAYYCGFWGQLNKDGKTSLFVNLRTMVLDAQHANLFVGGGITAQSVPEDEWEETALKGKVLLNYLT
jgi:isochorismate synthase